MAKTSSSWGHAIKLIAPAELEPNGRYSGFRTYGCSSGLRCPNKRERTHWYGWPEETEHHSVGGGDVVFLATYRFITGRRGNVGERQLGLCQTCAEKFAAKNRLELPAAEIAAQ